MALLPLALSVGVLAAIWTFVSPMVEILTWPAFIGWAFFFVAGADARAVTKAGLPLASGALLAWAAVAAGPTLGIYGIPLAVGVAAFIMVAMGNQALFALIPAQFVGAAVFFGAGAVLVPTLISLAVGLIIGYVSVTLPALAARKQPEASTAAA
jgi:hypothetical protein